MCLPKSATNLSAINHAINQSFQVESIGTYTLILEPIFCFFHCKVFARLNTLLSRQKVWQLWHKICLIHVGRIEMHVKLKPYVIKHFIKRGEKSQR